MKEKAVREMENDCTKKLEELDEEEDEDEEDVAVAHLQDIPEACFTSWNYASRCAIIST